MDVQIERKISSRGEYYMTDAIEIMIEQGKKLVTRDVAAWRRLRQCRCAVADECLGALDRSSFAGAAPGSVIVHPSFVHRDAVLENAVVGPYASIGAGALVRNARWSAMRLSRSTRSLPRWCCGTFGDRGKDRGDWYAAEDQHW